MSELTREQVEEVFNAVYWHGDQQGAKQCKVLDGIDALRATIEQQAQELEQAKGSYAIQKAAADDYEQQLAASQARCREMESKEIALKKHIELIQARLEHEVNRPSKLEDDIAQLQATLAARGNELEAALAEQRVLDSKYVDERAARFKAQDEADQYYKCLQIEKGEHATALAERDTARQDAARLREALEAVLPIAVEWCSPEEATEMAAIEQAQRALKGA